MKYCFYFSGGKKEEEGGERERIAVKYLKDKIRNLFSFRL